MTDDRLAHLDDVSAALWPRPLRVDAAGRPRSAGVVGEYWLLPNRRRPRLLAPAGRRAAAAVVRARGGGRAVDRVKAATLALGLRCGLGPLVWRERLVVTAPTGVGGSPTGTGQLSLPGHLAAVLGEEVVMGMQLTGARANRKPVLHLLTPAGRTVAYAKLGVDDLTDTLVGRETDALTDLGRRALRAVEVPAVRHSGRWRGHRLLVQSALPVTEGRRALTRRRLIAAVTEIAAVDRRDGILLADAPFRTDLAARVSGLPHSDAATRLAALIPRVTAAVGTVRLDLGASHGDWAPWNMSAVADRLLVWDWERFRHGVPVGFDLLHHDLQRDLVRSGADPSAAAARMMQEATIRLEPLIRDRRTALATVVLYGADLAARYLADRQLEAGSPLGDVAAWLLPALDHGIDRLEGDT